MPANSVFDLGAWFEPYRAAMAPFVRMNEEGLHALRRYTRLHNESLGDYLDSECEHLQAMMEAREPADLARAHGEHMERLSEQWRKRTAQFFDTAAETHGSLSRTAGDVASKTAESVSAAATESHRSGRAGSEAAKAENARAEASRGAEAGRRPS